MDSPSTRPRTSWPAACLSGLRRGCTTTANSIRIWQWSCRTCTRSSTDNDDNDAANDERRGGTKTSDWHSGAPTSSALTLPKWREAAAGQCGSQRWPGSPVRHQASLGPHIGPSWWQDPNGASGFPGAYIWALLLGGTLRPGLGQSETREQTSRDHPYLPAGSCRHDASPSAGQLRGNCRMAGPFNLHRNTDKAWGSWRPPTLPQQCRVLTTVRERLEGSDDAALPRSLPLPVRVSMYSLTPFCYA